LVADRDVAPGEDGEQLTVLPEVAPVVALGAAGLDDGETAANGICDSRLRRLHCLGWRSGRGEVSCVNGQGFRLSRGPCRDSPAKLTQFDGAAYLYVGFEPPLPSLNSACTIIRTTSGLV